MMACTHWMAVLAFVRGFSRALHEGRTLHVGRVYIGLLENPVS